MTGVGAGVGTGVGSGVGTGVGARVGSGVGTGVGAGVGCGVGLNVEPGGSGVGASDSAAGDGAGVGDRDAGLLVAGEVDVIAVGLLVNATASVELDSVVLAVSSASNHSQPVDSSLHSSIESNVAQNASPWSMSMSSSSATTPIAQITTRTRRKIVFCCCFCLVSLPSSQRNVPFRVRRVSV
jgi:hypothetical protein